MEDYQWSELTDKIICSFYSVYNILGYGFLEKVYVNALRSELQERGVKTVAQHPIRVMFKKTLVGEYFCDLMIENKIIVEIKAIRHLSPEHDAQLLNYLRATNKEVGLLLNFGPKPQIRRKAFANHRKDYRQAN